MENQNIAPILILLALAGAILYLHFSGGNGLTRLYLTAVLVVTAILLLIPSGNFELPGPWKSLPRIQLGLDLQGGTHLLLEVKLDEAVKTALQRRGADLKRELTDNKLDFESVTNDADGSILVKLKNPDERSAFQDLVAKSYPDLVANSAPSESGGPVFKLTFRPRDEQLVRTNAMDQALET
ncbi:MAG TPA: hypothetical protein VGI47_10300, partial [Candidatus Binataceae bacterium]